MPSLLDAEQQIKHTKSKISDIEKGLIEFKQKKPLAEKSLTEKKNFDFKMTFLYLDINNDPNFKASIYSFNESSIEAFKTSLDNVIPYVEKKLDFFRKQLTEQEKQLGIVRGEVHAEDQHQADLVVYKQGELNKIQIEKLRAETEHAEQEQERRKARFDQLSSLGNRSENLRRELERDWEQRRTKQDSERESIYQFVFDRDDKS